MGDWKERQEKTEGSFKKAVIFYIVTIVLYFVGTKISIFFGSLFSYLTIYQLIRAIKKEIKTVRLHAKTLVSEPAFKTRLIHTVGITLLLFVLLSVALFIIAEKRLPYGSLVKAFVRPFQLAYAFVLQLFS